MWIRSPRSSTERRSSRLLLAALVAALCLASRAGAQQRTADEIRQRARSVLEQEYQKELPEAAPRSTTDAPAFFGPLAHLALVILVVLAVVALILAVLWLAGNLRSTRTRSPAAPGEDGYLAGEPAGETGPSLAEAERLAAEGRWSEAVHALLLISVRRLCARFSVPQASSRTSRELSRALPLQGEVREAFAGLVRTVEISLFGGTPLGPDDWRASLERFRRIEGRG